MNVLEHIYHAGLKISRRIALGDTRRLPACVISIGNITVGGTGKTPAVIALASEVLNRGLRPCILTRGYGGSVAGPCFVSRGDGPLMTPGEAGDEPYLMAVKLTGAEIIKGADRYRAGLLSRGADVFILDDGFQHRRLHRDLDIVLIDSTRGFGNGRLLPLGPLREPPEEIGRADILVLTRAAAPGVGPGAPPDALPDALRDASPDALNTPRGPLERFKKTPAQRIYRARHKAMHLIDIAGVTHAPEMLRGADVFAFCALANPGAFFKSVEETGALLVGRMEFRDHYRYGVRDLKNITARARALGAGWIITTEKDIIKTAGLKATKSAPEKTPKNMPERMPEKMPEKMIDAPQSMLALAVEFEIPGGFYDEIFAAIGRRLGGDSGIIRQ